MRNEKQLTEQVQAVNAMKDDLKNGSKLDLEKIEFAIAKQVEDQYRPMRSQIQDVVMP